MQKGNVLNTFPFFFDKLGAKWSVTNAGALTRKSSTRDDSWNEMQWIG